VNRIPSFLKWLVINVLALAILTSVFYFRGQQQEIANNLELDTKTQINSLLIQLADDDRTSRAFVLLIKENDTELVAINISPKIAIQFGEAGLMSAEQAGTQVSPEVISDAIATATGIRIDGTITLQRLAIAGLVDSVDGVEVNAKAGLLVSGPDEDPLYVPPGQQRLDGQHAAGYAMFQQFIEDESALFSRTNEVIRAIFNNVPIESGALDETLASLGSLARSDISTQDISDFFLSLNRLNLWPAANYQTIETQLSELELMPETDWLEVKQPETYSLLAKLVPNTLLQSDQSPVRFEVLSEFSIDRAVVASEISELNLRFIDGGRIDSPPITQIKVSVSANISDVEALRAKLGLEDVLFEWDFTLGEYSDVRIVIGVDYRDRDQVLESVN